MALTKVSGQVIQQPFDVGIVTATSGTFGSLDVSGNVTIGGTVTYEDVTNIDSVGIITARTDIHVGAGLSVVGVSTLRNTVVGGATTELVVNGDARVTGILTALDLEFPSNSSSISDTALDIFVYDTRNDSDGGAWRKRTQHTSWYNETLNTATRGSRREFPRVAVIVVQTGENGNVGLSVYDGDHPDLPMWMTFVSNNGSYLQATCTSVSALNGTFVVGGSNRLRQWNFISEEALSITVSNTSKNIGNISQRNSQSGWYEIDADTQLANGVVNGVAMKVTPNSPVDPLTGLPKPAVAVATDDGITLFHNTIRLYDPLGASDETVGITTTTIFGRGAAAFVSSVEFSDNNSVIGVWGHADDARRHIVRYAQSEWVGGIVNDIDLTTGYHQLSQFGAVALQSPLRSGGSGIQTGFVKSMRGEDRIAAKWDNYGLKIAELCNNPERLGMVAGIRTDFNTGWMHGDCKGAFLSDTDTTNITGSNLIDNGDFGTGDFTNWSINGTTTPTISLVPYGGALITAGAIDGAIWQSTSGEATSGKWVITWVVTTNSGGFFGLFLNNDGPNGSGGFLSLDNITTSGSHYYEGSITAVEFRHRGSSSGIIDNITLTRVEDDRSVNNQGLAVYGTVTKSAVATGAELVAYSGFSASNYLEQPFNANLMNHNDGDADFYYSCWVNCTTGGTGNQTFIDRSSSTNGTAPPRARLHLWDNAGAITDTVRMYTDGGEITGNIPILDIGWTHVFALRRGTTLELYINGVLQGVSTTNTDFSTSIAGQVRIGLDGDGTDPLTHGSIALVKIGNNLVRPTQIRKIYEDEKLLFLENAKCTLYGTTSNVKAIAYDQSTKTLHIGTDDGRSDFVGLRRINNTTVGITSAISAQNGLIAEQ
jgi:hypothetical protein